MLKRLMINRITRRMIAFLPAQLEVKVKQRNPFKARPSMPMLVSPSAPPPRGSQRHLPELGFPVCDPTSLRVAPSEEPQGIRSTQLPDIKFEGRQGNALVSVCSTNYVFQARAMISSVREHHSPEDLAIYLLVVDWDGKDPLDIPQATVLSGQQVGIDLIDYMALKYTASELCCACKPYILRYVMATTSYQKVLYFDSDIYVFARLDHMLECLDQASLVVLPHTLAPTPNRDRFNDKPALGALIAAGTYNAGMFGMTTVPENVAFTDQWAELVTEPGAFLGDLGSQHEQNFFNWLAGLADQMKLNKNTAYNVAYWNLHDRSLRYNGWDDADQAPGWTVDGQPLVAFHFSGFSLDEPRRISLHDTRYSLYTLPSLTMLLDFYLAKLFEHGALKIRQRPYRFDKFPSGLDISPEMRHIFKKYESYLWRDASPWSEAGEHHYLQSLFLPIAPAASMLPIALYEIYQHRHDLQSTFPHAHLEPISLITWFSQHGINEEPVLYECFNRHRPSLPRMGSAQALSELWQENPAIFARLDAPLSKGRTALVNRLKSAGLSTWANRICDLEFENIVLSPIYLLWKFVDRETHLQTTFPDILFDDASEFGTWIEKNGAAHFLSPDLAKIFLQKAQGRSLARIFSFLNRTWEIASQWPLALVGQNKEVCARTLIALLQHDQEFDLDDVVMYLWTMAVKPWAGLALTFELQVNTCRQPSTRLPEGQEDLLGPLMGHPRFREALSLYREEYQAQQSTIMQARRYDRRISVMGGWRHSGLEQQRQCGVNFFGFFKSPIGLGSLSRGLALGLRTAQVKVQENVVGNMAMMPDLRPDDFLHRYDDALDTNLFLNYPHNQERLLRTYPDSITSERKNIIYLAWEQRDGYPSWAQDYADFDQIWALSDFAAGSFRRYMKRDDVVTVPGVIDFNSFPAAVTKQALGLNPDRFTFLYIFDANSSIIRKNPDAAIDAFAKAFSRKEKVQLLIKVSNSHRLEHRQKLRHLANRAARTGLDIQFLLVDYSYDDLLRLHSAVDCYVSLHRAEGFGYTCAEAMAYGKPIISSNYSATTEFMDEQSAFLVDCQECEVTVADGPFQRGSVWGDPSVDHAAAQMRRVYEQQREARAIGLAGQAKVRELLSAERAGRIAAAALANHVQK